MDAELIIEKNGREIRSRVNLDAGSAQITIETTIGEHPDTVQHRHLISVHPRPGYTREQLEYDVDQARHRAAETLLGTVEVKELLEGSKPSPGEGPRRVHGPEVPKPEKRGLVTPK